MRDYYRHCPNCRRKMRAKRDGRGYVLRWTCDRCNVEIPNLALDRAGKAPT